jgi:glycosyltransferase involved in cell wall biosynthesis
MNFESFKPKFQKVPVEHYPNEVPEEPMVSICVQTYQHADYIKDCLDGILMQETNYSFEILLGEDASTDGTREICIEYAEKYPEKIRLFLHYRENNIKINGNPTGKFNVLYNFYVAQGKYIALCEGDDYWTDPQKLQKQVNFLEENQDCSLCYHSAKVTYEDNSRKDTVLGPIRISEPLKFNVHEFINNKNVLGITTASMVFRASLIKNIPDFMHKIPTGDVCIKFLCAYNGKLGYIGGNPMSLHRRVTPGSWSAGLHSKEWHLQRICDRYFQWNLFDEYSGFKFTKEISKANKRKVAKILCQVQIYSSKKEFMKLMAKHINVLPYLRLKASSRLGGLLILGNKVYDRILSSIKRQKP